MLRLGSRAALQATSLLSTAPSVEQALPAAAATCSRAVIAWMPSSRGFAASAEPCSNPETSVKKLMVLIFRKHQGGGWRIDVRAGGRAGTSAALTQVLLLALCSITVTFKDDKDGSVTTVQAPVGKSILEASGGPCGDSSAPPRQWLLDAPASVPAVPMHCLLLWPPQVAHENNVELEGACEGSLACSTCHVIVEDQVGAGRGCAPATPSRKHARSSRSAPTSLPPSPSCHACRPTMTSCPRQMTMKTTCWTWPLA